MSPRDLLVEASRRSFGRVRILEWREAASWEDEVVLLAARRQHESACDLREFLRASDSSVGNFAERRHLHAEGVRRKVRGETWASLRDLAAWDIERTIEMH